MDDLVSCDECKQCNRKGKPSVTRYSTYCDKHHTYRVKTRKNWFTWFTDIKNKFFEKRAKYTEDDKLKDVDTKGFRPSWFWR